MKTPWSAVMNQMISPEHDMFNLRFDIDKLHYWADRYEYPLEEYIAGSVAPRVKRTGYLAREDFLAICDWKTARTRKHVESNPDEFIHEVTKVSFSTQNERLRIAVLTLLAGVSWPSASVILHFCHKDPYPILDFRALWSLGVEVEPHEYNFDFWWQYTIYCRRVADENSVTMRTLDKALWQYSKENQGKVTFQADSQVRNIIRQESETITLPHGGNGAAFPVEALIQHINESGRSFIIQGGVNDSFLNHPKPKSLDYWLRGNFTDRKDTRQAVAEVMDALVATGKFEIGDRLECPDSGRLCKGLRLLH